MGFFSKKPQPVMSDELAEACGAKPCTHHRYDTYGEQVGKYIVWRCSMCNQVMDKEYAPPFH